MNLFSILLSTKHDLAAKYPCTRRFFQTGFELDPRNHDDNVLGLISLNQIIKLNLITGDIMPVAPKELV